MPFNIVNELFTEQYWLFIFLVGLLILFWFISRDFKIRKKYLTTLALENTVPMNEMVQNTAEDAIMLLDSDFKLVGANAAFYSFTGLKERNTPKVNIQAFSRIFPKASRRHVFEQLKLMLQNGAGWLEATIQDAQGEAALMTISVYSICDADETIAYYITLTPRAELLQA